MSGADYPRDLVYPDHFHREATPAWIAATLTAVGQRAPAIDGPFRYLDLGCGSGLAAALLAAVHPHAQFTGVDFNPRHVAQAGALARHCPNLNVVESSFDSLAGDPAMLGEPYDFIVLHGVYSWVSPAQRDAIGMLIERLLAPGGIVYLHYTTHPGHSAVAGLQAMLHRSAAIMPGDSTAKIEQAFSMVRALARGDAGYFAAQPAVASLIEQRGESAAYLAHDLLPRDWSALHVADVIDAMSALGCDYVGSATLIENVDLLSVPAASVPVIGALPEVRARETARDLARNQSLRRDLYRRGWQGLSPAAYRDQLDTLRIVGLGNAPVDRDLIVPTRAGAVSVDAAAVLPLREALRGNAVRTFGALRRETAQDTGISLRAMLAMIAAGEAHPAIALVPDAVLSAQRLNRALVKRGDQRGWLAAPGIGSAIAVDATGMALTRALLDDPALRGAALARHSGLDVPIIAAFERETLPRWQALGIIPNR